MMRVTVDIYSGRPNPSWELEGAVAEKVLSLLAQNRQAVLPSEQVRSILGFRGLVVELDQALAEKFELPASLRIASGLSEAEDAGRETAHQIVSLMTDQSLTDAGDALFALPERDALLREIKEPNAPEVKKSALDFPPPKPGGETAMIDGGCRYEVQAYDPSQWNSPAHVTRNNCYNFGTNRMWDNFAQPGYGGGVPARPPFNCRNVSTACFADGLRLRGQCAPASERPRFLIALAVRPDGTDYHWWRQCSQYWAHKPGRTPATDRDSSGNLITDPATCNRGTYTDFCGYFYVPRHINLSGIGSYSAHKTPMEGQHA